MNAHPADLRSRGLKLDVCTYCTPIGSAFRNWFGALTTALFVDQSEALIGGADLCSSFVRRLRLRGARVRIIPDRQAEQRCRVLECATPVCEVVGPPGIAGEPRAHVDAELVKPGFLGVVHRLDQLVVPDQVPVFGKYWLLLGFVQIACRAELCRTDNPGTQPAGAVDSRIALPDHQFGRELVQHPAAGRPKRALLGGADGRDLVADACAFSGSQNVSGRRRVEHAQSDVGAGGDVAEELKHTPP